MVITSLDNAKIAEVKRLYDKKYRRMCGRYIIEGIRLVNDAVKYGAKITSVFVKESIASNYNFDNQVIVSDKIFSKISDTVNGQGVLAVAEKFVSELKPPRSNALVLDCVQDPGNAGTLIRTAVACGFTDIYAVNSVDLYSPKVLRSAMSAHFCLNLYESGSLEETFEALRNSEIIACDLDGENVFKSSTSGKVALVLGNEGNGLSEYSKMNCHRAVTLPMAGKFESLNVAVAGSVIMYKIFSERF